MYHDDEDQHKDGIQSSAALMGVLLALATIGLGFFLFCLHLLLKALLHR